MIMQQQNIATSYASILGQMIRELRDKHSSDQKDLAECLGVSVMTVSRIETGDTVLDVPQMEKVAKFFNFDPVEFYKKSLEAKQKVEQENYRVFQNKKEINQHPDMAILGLAAIVGLIAAVLISKR
jgi:transcriptional regulator with XRE-family HTH domain